MIRSIVVACAFVVAAGSAFVPDYWAAVADRRALRTKVDHFSPEFRRFVHKLPGKTRRGETVAVVLSAPHAPPYFHAMKNLAGRTVLLANGETGKDMQRVPEADVVAVWPDTLGVPAPFHETERFDGGVIARR
ncbi:MAG TPA: hypothetical protein VGF69_24570 [Thermoanaerobaculia bacterium]